ncbi:MAG: tRNA lysidine(34) synthetase TilS, partial [Syntrophothermus sp.]
MAKTAGVLIKTIEQKVISFADEFRLIAEGSRILVALSGGPDSVFALKFLHKYEKRFKIQLGAAHINHSLRGEDSDRDEQFCHELAEKLGIHFYSRRVDVLTYAHKNKLSVEEAARILRYNVLEELAETDKYDKIVTAHNMNDNTETVLLNLIKGTGLKGISGIPPERGKIIRPFLSLKKEEILQYLHDTGTEYRIDESNKKNDYERNFIRNILLPSIKDNLNPSAEQNIFNSSVNFRNIQSFLDAEIDEAVKKTAETRGHQVILSIEKLNGLHPSLLGEIVKKLITETFSGEFEYKDLSIIKSLLANQPGRSAELGRGIMVYRERDSLLFMLKENENECSRASLKIGESAELCGRTLRITEVRHRPETGQSSRLNEYICADSLGDEFVFRIWQPGDKFIPLGMSGFKK